MKKIRIGNDIKVVWEIRVNGGEAKLSELKDTALELSDSSGRKKRVGFSIENESVIFDWRAKDQRHTGKYTLTFWANFGKEGQAVIDCCDFVNLVSRSCKSDDTCSGLHFSETVKLNGELSLGVQGKSAYQVWLDNGHEGPETDFLEWLRLPSIEAAGSAAYLSEIEETDDVNF